MGVFENSTLSMWCHSNRYCVQLATEYLGGVKETASYLLGLISVIVWVVAEIPQILTNYKSKSTDGLSVTFLITWIIGDLFNLFGCLLEPATLLTQLYMAVLYTIITFVLGAQTIYYGHIYPQLKYKKQLKAETFTKVGQVAIASETEQIQADNSNGSTGLSSPIPLPACPQRIPVGRELFYQSARYFSKSHTPTAGSILTQRTAFTPPTLDSIKENLLGSPTTTTRSAPSLKIKNTLCLVSTFTFLSAINLLQPLDRRNNPVVPNPRQQFVIYVGRKLFQQSQVIDDQLPKTDIPGGSSIGTFLGWIMTFIYLGGRLPQICLNIKRGHVEGLNPLMFLFALIGNVTILVISVDWLKIRPNLPWLVDAADFNAVYTFPLLEPPRTVD